MFTLGLHGFSPFLIRHIMRVNSLSTSGSVLVTI